MSEPATGLALLAMGQGLLDDVGAFLTANLAIPPERVYLSPGAPGLISWDCEQLVVSLAAVTWGINEDAVQPVPQAGSGAGIHEVRYAQWSVQLVRCTPVQDDSGQPPASEVIQAAGELAINDAGLLSQATVNIAAFPAAHSWVPVGALVKAGGVVSLGPQGGFHGFEATLSITATDLE